MSGPPGCLLLNRAWPLALHLPLPMPSLPPQVLVSTSAVGFYGISESQTFSETSNSGNDYLAEVGVQGGSGPGSCELAQGIHLPAHLPYTAHC